MFMNAAASKMLGLERRRAARQADARNDPLPARGWLAVPQEECELRSSHERTAGSDGGRRFHAQGRHDPPDRLLRRAVAQRHERRGMVVVFRDTTEEQAERARRSASSTRSTWVGRIRDALDDDRLVLYSQPIVSLSATR